MYASPTVHSPTSNSGPAYFESFQPISYSSNGDGTLTHLVNATLQQIHTLAQQDDVEMQVPLNERKICLVVDTNVLLDKQKLLEQFVRDHRRRQTPILVIIPGVVLHELDGLKKRDRLGWFARRASSWILDEVKSKSITLRVQRDRETCKQSGDWKIWHPGQSSNARANDGLILDCCMYFHKAMRYETTLCSGDINLRTEHENEGNGHDLGNFLLGTHYDPQDYTGPESISQEQNDDSMMDVDEEIPKLTIEQAMDLLHIQVIEHFTRRLRELVARFGPEPEDGPSNTGVGASRHAPRRRDWGATHYREWNAKICLAYLDEKKPMRTTHPRVDVFLTDPYTKDAGARKGREWPHEAWKVALDGLYAIAKAWNDLSIEEDLNDLKRHREIVFKLLLSALLELSFFPSYLLLMRRRRAIFALLTVLGLFLFGTVVVLTSVTLYLAIDPSAYLTELEVPYSDPSIRWNATEHGQVERIPRILHQTWKTGTLPEKWKGISQECRDMMPDYEYMLWTDESSREFIARHYPWFLNTFDDYSYAILRADAIRYFVLYHYGGIYLDLDIGCLRPLDPLLVYPVILPKTIPVGVSNDLMFAQKHHPFLAQTIHNLATFDHSWILNYPTVMFSTGPMFLSIQHGIYSSQHVPGGNVRILPKTLYGKNAEPAEAPHSFFTHHYGSSWHSDDAAFIWFLAIWGKGLMWIGLAVLLIGSAKFWPSKQRRRNLRRMGGYDVLFPRRSQRTGRWQIHVGEPESGTSTQMHSPDGSEQGFEDLSLLHLPFDVRSSSPTFSESSNDQLLDFTSLFDVVKRARALITGDERLPPLPHSPRPRRSQRYRRGVLFFLPAMFAQPQDMELAPSFSRTHSSPPIPLLQRPVPRGEKHRYEEPEVYAEASPIEVITEGVKTLRASKGSGPIHGHKR
ncbi:glycosyltransferase family 32 protein [Favolaschia claudopus]|uniref:Glycosyltransferase family 32 protein n=1 Tax=Favolaschia claudopus TaxID=2862362 RepID=A0AAW0EA57_9AGAR